jgi:hypothetical protein
VEFCPGAFGKRKAAHSEVQVPNARPLLSILTDGLNSIC